MAARLYFESDQTTNTLSNILMMMTSEPANPLPCSFCSWIVSVKMRPLSFSPYLSHWCWKKYKKKWKLNQTRSFCSFLLARIGSYIILKTINVVVILKYLLIYLCPTKTQDGVLFLSTIIKKINNPTFDPFTIRWMTLSQRFHDEQWLVWKCWQR